MNNLINTLLDAYLAKYLGGGSIGSCFYHQEQVSEMLNEFKPLFERYSQKVTNLITDPQSVDDKGSLEVLGLVFATALVNFELTPSGTIKAVHSPFQEKFQPASKDTIQKRKMGYLPLEFVTQKGKMSHSLVPTGMAAAFMNPKGEFDADLAMEYNPETFRSQMNIQVGSVRPEDQTDIYDQIFNNELKKNVLSQIGNDECATFRVSIIGTIESFRVSYDKTKKNGGFKWPMKEIDKDGLGGGIKQFINVNSCLMAISRFQTSPLSYEVTKRQFSMAKETMRKAGVIEGDRKPDPIKETDEDWEEEELLKEAEETLKDEQTQPEETSNQSEQTQPEETSNQSEQTQPEKAPSTTPETMTSTGNKFAGEDPDTYYRGFLDQLFEDVIPSSNFSAYGFKALKILLLDVTGRASKDKLKVALNSHDGELSRRLGSNFGKIEREYYEAEDDGDQLVISINKVVSELTADGELSEEKVIAKAKKLIFGNGASDSQESNEVAEEVGAITPGIDGKESMDNKVDNIINSPASANSGSGSGLSKFQGVPGTPKQESESNSGSGSGLSKFQGVPGTPKSNEESESSTQDNSAESGEENSSDNDSSSTYYEDFM